MPPVQDELIRNERTKLTANALDRASTACLTIGVLGPSVAVLYGVGGNAIAVSGFIVAAGAIFWLLAAGMLHWMARFVLGRLR